MAITLRIMEVIILAVQPGTQIGIFYDNQLNKTDLVPKSYKLPPLRFRSCTISQNLFYSATPRKFRSLWGKLVWIIA